MTADWHVELQVGGRAWAIGKGDPATVDDLPVVLDGLQMGWAYAQGDLFPDQPQPTTLTFQLLFDRSSVAADDVRIGSPVDFRLVTDAYAAEGDPDFPTATFSGRIGAVSAAPCTYGQDLDGQDLDGVLYTIVATDVVAQLGELLVGATPWPAEHMLARVNHVWHAAGFVDDLWTLEDLDGGTPVAARDVDAQTALDLLTSYLRQWPYSSLVDTDPHRLVLTGHQSAPVDAYELVELPDHITEGRYPGRLHADGTVSFTNTGVSGGIGTTVLDASWLDFEASWTQRKGSNPNTTTVAGDAGAATASTGEFPPVAVQVTGVELTDVADMQRLAGMYLPSMTQQSAWTVDSFRLFGDLDAVDLRGASLMLSSRDDGDDVQRTLCGVVVIDNIPSTLTPVFQYVFADAFYAGMLTGATLTIADGSWVVDFQLRPDLPRPPAAGDGFALTWANLAAQLPTLTWAEMDSVYTWADARLIGRS